MIVRPPDADRPRGPAPLRPETPVRNVGAGRESAPPEALPDRSEVSEAARGLAAANAAGAEAPALAPGRLRAVAERLRTGHYDQEEVLREVAQRILAAWTGEAREG